MATKTRYEKMVTGWDLMAVVSALEVAMTDVDNFDPGDEVARVRSLSAKVEYEKAKEAAIRALRYLEGDL